MDTSQILAQLKDSAKALNPWIVERRRYMHQNPEISFQEKETAAWLRREVELLGLVPSDPVREDVYGFYTEIKSSVCPDKYVLLRADFDALKIQEQTDVPFKSTKEGVAHLCGHDAHTSMLLGALKLLKENEDKLPYSVRFVFQHAEEMPPGGAADFVRAGLVAEDVISCFALHVTTEMEAGIFGMCPGEAMAMVGNFDITLRGNGGHAARPHECNDTILAASQVIQALQQIVSRRLSPTTPAVISVANIHGGSTHNALPSEVSLGGTIRVFDESLGEQISGMIMEIAGTVAAAYGCEADVAVNYVCSPVFNDPQAQAASYTAIQELFGENALMQMEKRMGAEDFSRISLARPSSFVYLGVQPESGEFFPLHHPRFSPEESVLWRGSALLAAMPFVV